MKKSLNPFGSTSSNLSALANVFPVNCPNTLSSPRFSILWIGLFIGKFISNLPSNFAPKLVLPFSISLNSILISSIFSFFSVSNALFIAVAGASSVPFLVNCRSAATLLPSTSTTGLPYNFSSIFTTVPIVVLTGLLVYSASIALISASIEFNSAVTSLYSLLAVFSMFSSLSNCAIILLASLSI